MVKFLKVNLPDAHIFKGNEFPVAYTLDQPVESTDEVLQFLKEQAKTGFFLNELRRHGTVVLRGLGKSDPDTLGKYIKAVSNDGLEYFVQNGSTAQRHEINDVLSTANEGPPSRILFQHNEFSRFIKYPSTLFFVCSKFDAEGGETPIVHGGELFDKINFQEPGFVRELGKKGIYFEQVWPLNTENNTSWSDRFCFGRNVDKEADMELRKKQAGKLVVDTVSPDYEWDKDNNLIVHQHTKAIRLYDGDKGDEYPVFFNSLPTFYGDIKYSFGGFKKTSRIKYDDGSYIPEKYLDLILETTLDIQYNHKWETGDVVIVDNYQVSHGREPWKGERKILVSMWDHVKKPDFPAWE